MIEGEWLTDWIKYNSEYLNKCSLFPDPSFSQCFWNRYFTGLRVLDVSFETLYFGIRVLNYWCFFFRWSSWESKTSRDWVRLNEGLLSFVRVRFGACGTWHNPYTIVILNWIPSSVEFLLESNVGLGILDVLVNTKVWHLVVHWRASNWFGILVVPFLLCYFFSFFQTVGSS